MMDRLPDFDLPSFEDLTIHRPTLLITKRLVQQNTFQCLKVVIIAVLMLKFLLTIVSLLMSRFLVMILNVINFVKCFGGSCN